MDNKLIVSWDEYNKTVENLAIQVHDSGFKVDLFDSTPVGVLLSETIVADLELTFEDNIVADFEYTSGHFHKTSFSRSSPPRKEETKNFSSSFKC